MPHISPASIIWEADIVWLQDVMEWDYVRQSLLLVPYRQRKPRRGVIGDGEVVGYSILDTDAPSADLGRFYRRVFWVKRHDRHAEPEGVYASGCPVEAVDPRTLAPGVIGNNDRAWT